MSPRKAASGDAPAAAGTPGADLAKVAWDAYSCAIGGKAFNGDELP